MGEYARGVMASIAIPAKEDVPIGYLQEYGVQDAITAVN